MQKRGRPTFEPTKPQKDKVKLLIGFMSEVAIASVLNIDHKTLRKHFAFELQNGRALTVAENLARLKKAAKAGNVTAMKYLDAKLEVTPEKFQKPEPLGKKETLDMEAKTGHVGSEWGDVLQ